MLPSKKDIIEELEELEFDKKILKDEGLISFFPPESKKRIRKLKLLLRVWASKEKLEEK